MVSIFLYITYCCNNKIRPSYYQKMLPPYHVQLVPWTSDLSEFAHYGAILSCAPSKKPKTTLDKITALFQAAFSIGLFSRYRLGPWISPISFFAQPSLLSNFLHFRYFPWICWSAVIIYHFLFQSQLYWELFWYILLVSDLHASV